MADTKPNNAGEQQPVDDRSRYAEMSAAEMSKELAHEVSDSKKPVVKQSGAISGALDPTNPKDRPRTEEHARKTYERIRNTKDDVQKIARTTGHTEEEIQRVKQHMFFDEHNLATGIHRFDPDFYQAQSWDRLQSGKPLPHDLVLIEHELIESRLMAQGKSYDEAHKEANKTANYRKSLEEYKDALFKKKRN